jgi:hypothetical protein
LQNWRFRAAGAVLASAVLTALITAPASAALAQPGQTQSPGSATRHPTAQHPAAQLSPSPNLTSVWCSGSRFCLTVGLGSVSAVWNGKSWGFVKMPATKAQTLQLGCVSRTNCMAIGGPGNGSHAVIDRWNGSSWRPLHPPAASAASVACAAGNRCIAVGGRNGALAWNGRSWRKVKMSKPAGVTGFELTGVSCASSASCLAVGSFVGNHETRGMAVAWNGRSWRLLPAPPAVVTAVSCPEPGRCVAVGARLSLTWNGKSWHKVLINGVPGFDVIDHISCSSFSFCVAEGTTAVAWNGTSWKVLPDTKIDDNEGIWCTSPANCMDVGGQASHWDGRAWTPVRLTKVDQLETVSCASSGDCVATGISNAARFGDTTMAESWNGTSWRVLPVPLESIQQISCASATFCLAMMNTSPGPQKVQSWNGSKWSALPSPSNLSDVQAVACSSASSCVALGSSTASIWNGTSWQATSTAVNGKTIFLDAVSCASATMCMAIGVEESSSCHHDCTASLLAEQWNGSSWSVSFDSPDPDQAGQSGDEVSCPTATFCMENTGTGTMSWDGSSWHPQNVDVPDFSGTGLSCGSTTSCVITEDIDNPETDAVSFAAKVWNGTSWKASDPVGHISRLASVSCSSATSCLAVGRDINGLAMAQSWNGTTWKLLSPINP